MGRTRLLGKTPVDHSGKAGKAGIGCVANVADQGGPILVTRGTAEIGHRKSSGAGGRHLLCAREPLKRGSALRASLIEPRLDIRAGSAGGSQIIAQHHAASVPARGSPAGA